MMKLIAFLFSFIAARLKLFRLGGARVIVADNAALCQHYYNEECGHCALKSLSLRQKSDDKPSVVISLDKYKWKMHYRGLFSIPTAS